MADWQLLESPTDAVQSVNGKSGTVILSTTDINEGTNKYFTDTRVSNNPTVSANTSKLSGIEAGAQVNITEYDGNGDLMPKE
jgi:hypothetical protein